MCFSQKIETGKKEGEKTMRSFYKANKSKVKKFDAVTENTWLSIKLEVH